MIELQLFDIKTYLEDQGIPVYDEGKNISEGWIGIECLWCSDNSNHLGINLESKIFKCWKCGEAGPATKIIMEVEGLDYWEAVNRMKEYQDPYFLHRQEPKKLKVHGDILCKGCKDKFTPLALDYLKSRNFDPDIIIPKYKLKCTQQLGNYKFRIIIPVIMNYEIVGFTSRDYTGKSEVRYKKSKVEESRINHKEWLYNIDNVKDKLIIVEGPIDVWRLGDGCISLFTTEFSDKQIEILVEKNLKEAYILFDSEKQAQKKANRLANNLSAFIPTVEILELEKGDPADLTNEEAKKLISEIF